MGSPERCSYSDAMAGDDQSSLELGENSAEAMVNQTKSTARQIGERRAHLGILDGRRGTETTRGLAGH